MYSNNKREISTLKRRHNKDDILLNIDKYNIEVLESDFKELKNINNKEYEDISKFVIHKNDQNKNTFYRDKNDKKSYIMYDDNYDSIEYNFDKKMVICYGKNEKPVFKHNLYTNLQEWFEYDYNNNELYTYTSDNLSYLNIYDYYGKLILTEKFIYN